MATIPEISPYKGDGTTPLFQKWLDILWKWIREVSLQRPTLGTPQATTSGTEFDFTIPSWATEIAVLFGGCSLSGTENFLVQIGDAGGVEPSGYDSSSFHVADAAATAGLSSTAGFIVRAAVAGTGTYGRLTLTLIDSSTFTWEAAGVFHRNGTLRGTIAAGEKSLSAALTTVRITRTGADTFDAGKVNVRYA